MDESIIIMHNNSALCQKMCYLSLPHLSSTFGNDCKIIQLDATEYCTFLMTDPSKLKRLSASLTDLSNYIQSHDYSFLTIGRTNFIDCSGNDISYYYDAHIQIIKTLQLSDTDFSRKFISLCENITSQPVDDTVYYFEQNFDKLLHKINFGTLKLHPESEPYMSISKFLSEHGLNVTKFIDEFKNDIIEAPQFSFSNFFLENEIRWNHENKISDLVKQAVKFEVCQFAQCK